MSDNKVKRKEVPDDADELLIQLANQQFKADYRRSLGKEYARRNWDIEIGKVFKKKKE